MPVNPSVRSLDDKLTACLKRRAARHGRSAETQSSLAELAAQFRALTTGRAHTPAEVLAREGRDER